LFNLNESLTINFQLDESASKSFFSFIVAANPLGQFIVSPLLGYWANKSPSIRSSIIASLIVFIISSAFYASLNLFGSGVEWWMVNLTFDFCIFLFMKMEF
jgi:MFS family permease